MLSFMLSHGKQKWLGERNQNSDGPADFQGDEDVLHFIGEVIIIGNISRGHPSPPISDKIDFL